MKAVILAGGLDIGRCPLSMVRPKALFPMLNRVLLQHTLQVLKGIGVSKVIICANDRLHLLQDHLDRNPVQGIAVEILDDERPRGTAGCLADAVHQSRDMEPFIAVEGGVYIDGDLSGLVQDHLSQGAAVTLGAVPTYSPEAAANLAPLGAFMVEPEVLEFVPEFGFYDFKEQLLPKLHSRSFESGISVFAGRYFRITTPQSYFDFLCDAVRGLYGRQHFLGLDQTAPDVWVAPDAEVSPFAEVIGPVAIGSGAVVESGSTIKGPAFIGEQTLVGARAEIARSILWPGSAVGAGGKITNSILTDSYLTKYNSVLSNCIAVDQHLGFGRLHGLRTAGYRVKAASAARAKKGKLSWATRILRRSAA